LYSVLYVDDEPALLEITKLFLERSNEFDIDTKSSAREAVEYLKDHSFDAIISDYEMPGMDGIAFLKVIRQLQGDIPFILFTGRGREDVVINAINNGADFYLQKGTDLKDQFAELAHKVRQAVLRKRAERSLYDSERRLSDIINFLPDATFAIDRSGQLIAWNRAIEEMTGVPAADILGKGNYEYSVPLYGTRRPALIDRIDEPDEKIAQFYTSIFRAGNTITAETVIATPKGNRLSVLVKVGPLYNTVGEVTGAIESIRDITDRKRAEDTVRESEGKFRELAELLPQMIFELDPDFRVTYANQHALSTLGFTSEDIRQELNAYSFIDSSQHARLKENIRKNLNGIVFEPQEYTALRKDGSTFPINIYSSPIYRDNTLAGFRGVVVDITARKKMVDGLRESEKRFRTIFENSPYPICINSIPDQKFVAINEAFRKTSGWTDEDILGKNPIELGLVSVRDAARLASKALLSGKIENVPLAISAKEGAQLQVQFSSIMVTINDKPNTVTMIAEITKLKRIEEELLQKNEELYAAYEQLTSAEEELRQNYNELHKNEQALRASEEMFRALVEHSLDGILITDFTGNILFVNRTMGIIIDTVNLPAIINRNVLEFVAPESQDDVIRDFRQVSQGTDAYLVCYKLITETKGEVWVECIGKKITFADSPAMLVSIRDVTERRNAESVLRESENKFSTVFRDSPVMLTIVSAVDGTFVEINDAFTRNTGYSRGDVIGKTAESLDMFPVDNEQEQLTATLKKTGIVNGMVVKCRNKAGVVITSLFSSRLTMMGGKPHILSTIENITERTAKDTAFHAMVRSMVGTTGLDSLHKITENVSSWLGADCVMLGEIQPGNPMVNVISMYLDGKHIPDFSYSLKGTPCEHVAETGFCIYSDHAIQLFPMAKDLETLNIRGYAGTSLRDSKGIVIGVLCALSRNPLQPHPSIREFMDIIAVKAAAEIERTRMERVLRESEEKYRLLADNVHDVIWTAGTDMRLTHVSPSVTGLRGMTSREAMAESLNNALTPESFLKIKNYYQQCSDAMKSSSAIPVNNTMDLEFRRKDGSTVWTETVITPAFDSNKEPSGIVGISRDISFKKTAEEELRLANRKLSLLSGITRHDIRNQLMALSGYLELSKKSLEDPVLLGKFIDNEKKIADTIAHQIRFTRDYEEVGVGAPAWQNINTVTSTAVNRLPLQNISIETGDPTLEVLADPLLEKVFYNIADNALRYGGEQMNLIRITNRRENGNLVIVVEDNGQGISREDKKQLFTKGFGRNTGLGLYLSREILSITGMTITENGEPGRGTRFEIMVPQGQYRFIPQAT